MFERFAIGVQPFNGGPAFFLEAMLRFRIDKNSGDIKFWYELARPDKALEQSTAQMISEICENTDVPVYFGAV